MCVCVCVCVCVCLSVCERFTVTDDARIRYGCLEAFHARRYGSGLADRQTPDLMISR